MLSKTKKAVNIGLVALGFAASAIGTVSSTASITTYLANPQTAECDGSCVPSPDYVCGLNGQNYTNKYFSS